MDYLVEMPQDFSKLDMYTQKWFYQVEYCQRLAELVDTQLYEHVSSCLD